VESEHTSDPIGVGITGPGTRAFGIHIISLGQPKYEEDEKDIAGD